MDATTEPKVYGKEVAADTLILSSGSVVKTDKGTPIITVAANGLSATVTGIASESMVDLTTTGNTTIGDTSADTLTVNSKLTGQLYCNDTGKTATTLKIHNHATTAEIGSLEAKGELVNTTGTVDGIASHWSYTPTGATGAPDAVRASISNMTLPAANTMTAGTIAGSQSATITSGTLNGAAVNEYGILAALTGGGTRTLCAHCAAVHAAVVSSVTNPTTGELSNILTSGNGVTTIDQTMFVSDHAHTTNFLNLGEAGNTGFVTTGGTDCTASAATDPSFTIKCIMPGGAPGYIRVWAAA